MKFTVTLNTTNLSALTVTHVGNLASNYIAPFGAGTLEVELTTGDTVQVFLANALVEPSTYTVSFRVYEDGAQVPTQLFDQVMGAPNSYGAWKTIFDLSALPVVPSISLLAIGKWEQPATKAMPTSFLPEASTIASTDWLIAVSNLGYGLTTCRISRANLATAMGTGGSGSTTNSVLLDYYGITTAHSGRKAYSGEHADPIGTSPANLIAAGLSELSDASYTNIGTSGGAGPSYTPAFATKKAFFLFKLRTVDLANVTLFTATAQVRPSNGVTDSIAIGMWNGTNWQTAVHGPMTGNGTTWTTIGSAHVSPPALTGYADANGFVWILVASTSLNKTLELSYASLKLTGDGVAAQPGEPAPALTWPLIDGQNPGGNDVLTDCLFSSRPVGAFPQGVRKITMSIPSATGYSLLDLFAGLHTDGNQYTGMTATVNYTNNTKTRVVDVQATPQWAGMLISGETGLLAKFTADGALFPPMTKAARNAISSPPNGLMIYQSDNTPGLRYRENGAWVKFTTVADP